ncbi:MAG: Crp/Fnr family transcriptional regulator [Cyclobacteriaceae bacterium]|nr:Crp/Fnr family transcriptional regulator [Cyclobacteriaceae bacterium]
MTNFLPKRRKVFPVKTLEQYHAKLITLRKDQMLVQEGDKALDFFQVEDGSVKMFIASQDGQEFIQGIFGKGESFGEPALIGKFPYPSNVVAIEKSKVWKLPSDSFFQLLKENFELHLKMDLVLCNRLKYKSMVLAEISSYDPEHRLLTLLRYFKSKSVKTGIPDAVIIPYTRQQLADMSGLRVETVIRTVKKMEKEGKLQLEGHKIKF